MMRIELRTGQLLAAALTLLLGAPVAAQDALHISPEGRVGIGRDAPVAPLDISGAPRTGTHPGMLGGLYVTGNFPPGGPGGGTAAGVEFRHSNGTQGIGFGYNTIYATGTNDTQNLNLQPQPKGTVNVMGSLTVSGSINGGGPVPVGAILMWSGNPADLPAGWYLCDGSNNTPDLRGRFIVGYNKDDGDYNSARAGGRAVGEKTAAVPAHSHRLGRPIDVIGRHWHDWAGSSTTSSGPSGNAVTTFEQLDGRGFGLSDFGGEARIDIRPPYYVLAYIMYRGN